MPGMPAYPPGSSLQHGTCAVPLATRDGQSTGQSAPVCRRGVVELTLREMKARDDNVMRAQYLGGCHNVKDLRSANQRRRQGALGWRDMLAAWLLYVSSTCVIRSAEHSRTRRVLEQRVCGCYKYERWPPWGNLSMRLIHCPKAGCVAHPRGKLPLAWMTSSNDPRAG